MNVIELESAVHRMERAVRLVELASDHANCGDLVSEAIENAGNAADELLAAFYAFHAEMAANREAGQ